MNYGFNKNCEDWQENKKGKLAYELMKLVNKLAGKRIGMNPYVEVDNLYDGIRIRRMTYLSDKQQEKLIKDAEKIYEKVMIK